MTGDETLAAAARARGVDVGAAVDAERLREDHAYRHTLRTAFTACTTENALKMGPLRPGPGAFDFRDADAIAAFAARHDLRLRGHTLVWHEQLPAWLEPWSRSDRELRDVLRAHVRTVAARYRGRVAAWDVVNEAVADDGTVRASPWHDAMGADYVARAFEWGREAAPDADLYYNDYGIAVPGEKADAVHDLLADLRDRGVPVDGVGLQCHAFDPDDRPDPAAVAATVERFQDLGLDVQVTELDVPVREDGDREAALAAQADYCGDLVGACLDAGVETVVTWGVADHTSWLPPRNLGAAPLLFDEDYEPKPARDAVRAALRGER